MCGISVAISKNNSKVNIELVKSMSGKVAHRGPDDEGFHLGDNFAFGHRRLSIIDLSKTGHQPMEIDDLVITYNGEVYNFIELREELISLGCIFQSSNDTEVILKAYQQWGVEAFSKFNGMWAFALVDVKKGIVIFCRDHFGIKPLYLAETKNYFLAASEIKQFIDIDDFAPQLNEKTAVSFLAYGWLNYSEQTFFKGVNELRPGHFLEYNLRTHKTRLVNWYDLGKSIVKMNDTYTDAVEKTRTLLSESVRLRMRSDVRVGSCLSGGIDSSSIVSIVAKNNFGHPEFETITSCFEYKKYDEQVFSDAMVKYTGFKNTKVFPDFGHLLTNGHFDKMIYHHDQPFNGGTHYSEFCVFRTANEKELVVMQSGQGADEFLCGYDDFFHAYLDELIRSLRFSKLKSVLKERTQFRGSDFQHEIKLYIRAKYFPTWVKWAKRLFGIKNITWLTKDWRAKAQKYSKDFQEASTQELALNQMLQSSLPYQLHSEDRNSMTFSIESRLPFLDHRLVEYCIGLPTDYKFRKGFTKAVLRDAMGDLPEIVKSRKHKMGFMFPDEEWMLSNPSLIRMELEKAIKTTNVFNADLLNRFDRFVDGELRYEPIYFRAIVFSHFCEIFKIEIDS